MPVENTPPLYFILAWLSAKLGSAYGWLRLPSVALGTATVPLDLHPGRQTVGRGAAVMAAGFFALSPFAVFYGIEARNYATLMFLTVLSALIVLKATSSTDRRWWVAYAVTATAILYTHYTGAFVVAAEGLWVLLYHPRRWRPLALASLAVALAYSVWLGNIAGQGTDVFGALATLTHVGYGKAFLSWLMGSPELPPKECPGVAPLVLLGAAGAVGGAGAVWSSGEAGPPGPSERGHRAGDRPRIRHPGQPARLRDLQR